jgi:hypothetical protein
VHSTPSHWLRWGLVNFLPGVAWSHHPSLSQPPKEVGLQAWATTPSYIFVIGQPEYYVNQRSLIYVPVHSVSTCTGLHKCPLHFWKPWRQWWGFNSQFQHQSTHS